VAIFNKGGTTELTDTFVPAPVACLTLRDGEGANVIGFFDS